MTPEDRALVGVSAALASGGADALDAALAVARDRCTPLAVEEALVQSYLFLGYPAALNALARWRALTGAPAARTEEEDPSAWPARGARVCQAVYGGQYDRLRRNIRALHPDMERWMVEEGYGRVLGRPGLDLKVRELCIVAVLAVLDAPRQLYSHLRGALNVGADPAEVAEVLDVAAGVSDRAARARAEETWASLRDRRDENEGA